MSTLVNLNYAQDLGKVTQFLNSFSTEKEPRKYVEQIKQISERQLDALTIELDDLSDEPDLLKNIETNTKRYINLFYDAVDSLMPKDLTPVHALQDDVSPLEVIITARMERDRERADMFPPILTRRYSLYLKPRSDVKPHSIREVKPEQLGKLVSVRGMVTKASNVKPVGIVLTMSCDRCGYEVFQEVRSQEVTPIVECPSDECRKNNTKGSLHLQTRACKFVKFQEVKIQELPDQVPMGHIPRTMTVHMYDQLTRQVSPGNIVTVAGVFLPIPYTGFKALRAGLLSDTILDAQFISHVKKQYKEMSATAEIDDQIAALQNDPNLYNRLASSIAPEIYGHEDIKKALLLLLVGGVSKTTNDGGMKIRGDLNICLMGDPGVAKSQLLKHICKVAPRSVYTTGRGSSGVGLTASVVRDSVTDELVLEAGALVLADNGIACIDEFDKMDESDRTAIHEVMEQQTISISKAGINTTLNARTSILAAANPFFGRYDRRKKATENINLPAALLSRFDLLFLILDNPNPEDDIRLAQHVTYVHMHNKHPTSNMQAEVIDPALMRHYIAKARSFMPKLTPQVGDFLVNAYVKMRKSIQETAEFQYTCARTLLSITRMATALARLRFSDEVDVSDVEEAMRLIDVSKQSIVESSHYKNRDPISVIFEEIRSMSFKRSGEMLKTIRVSDIKERIIRKGYSDEQLTQTIDHYERVHIWMRIAGGDKLQWLQVDEFESFDE